MNIKSCPNDSIRIALIGDIHIGAKIKDMDKQLIGLVDDLRELSDSIDIVVFLGDIFHKKIPFDCKEALLAHEIFRTFSKPPFNKIQFIIVKGTVSHDNDQLKHFYNIYPNIKVVDKYSHVTLNTENRNKAELDLLVVPEEVIRNGSEEYYTKRLFTSEGDMLIYDLIIGHGTLNFVPFIKYITKDVPEDKYTHSILSSPIMISQKWEEHTNSKMVFGHIHNKISSNTGKSFYPGSYCRWIHDADDESKSFTLMDYNQETGKTIIQEVPNKFDSKFVTKNIDNKFLDDLNKESFKNLLEENYDSLRLMINPDVSIGDERVNQLKEMIKNYDYIFITDKRKKQIIESLVNKIDENDNEESFVSPINDNLCDPYDILIQTAKEYGLEEGFIKNVIGEEIKE